MVVVVKSNKNSSPNENYVPMCGKRKLSIDPRRWVAMGGCDDGVTDGRLLETSIFSYFEFSHHNQTKNPHLLPHEVETFSELTNSIFERK